MVCPCELLEERQWVFKKRVPDKAFKWLSPRSGVAIYCNSHKTRRKTLLKSISFWVSDTSAKVPLLVKGSSWKHHVFSAWLVLWWSRPDAPFLASAFGLFAHEIDLKPWYHRTTSAFSFLAIFHLWPKNVKILILILGKAHQWLLQISMKLPLAKIELGSIYDRLVHKFSFSGLKMRLAGL